MCSLFKSCFPTAFMLCAFSFSAIAQEEEKAWSLSLDSITVRGFHYTSSVKTQRDGSIRWDMQMMDDLPKILGNADPLHYTQMLPGIQTNNEYKSGINIRGCENSHNLISIGGAPIYNASHLMGFFSTFNASHYKALSLHKNATLGSTSNRLGGELNMELPIDRPDSLGGELALGLISSQATLRTPLGQRTGLTASARLSYMNLFYSRWLKADDQQLLYSFYDANVTLSHRINDRHLLVLDAYSGNDRLEMNESHYLAEMGDHWGNSMAALHWFYDSREDFNMHTMGYVTNYNNKFSLIMNDADFQLLSGIIDIGLKSTANYRRWHYGIESVMHHVEPQSLKADGSFNKSNGHTPTTNSLETSLFVEYRQPIAGNVQAVAGLKGSHYLYDDKKSYTSADPSVALLYDDYMTLLSVSFSTKHQYLFQTGFSNMGLPSEFWLSSSDKRRPQYAYIYSAGASRYLFGRRYRLSLDAYYMQINRQIEYKGSVLDYVNSTYDIERNLIYGKGYNYGYSAMLQKCTGNITGWVSYTFTRARRTFEEENMKGYFPAAHERPHELTFVGSYSLNPHWSFGSTFVYATGTPFTAPRHIAFINTNFLIDYGEHNGSRLKPYARLDFSVNYKWYTRWLKEQGVNLSVYNATAHRNELFYYVSTKGGVQFAYKPVTFAIDVLPSVSYYCKF